MCHYMHMIQPQKQQLYANFPLSKALQHNADFRCNGHLIYGLTLLIAVFWVGVTFVAVHCFAAPAFTTSPGLIVIAACAADGAVHTGLCVCVCVIVLEIYIRPKVD